MRESGLGNRAVGDLLGSASGEGQCSGCRSASAVVQRLATSNSAGSHMAPPIINDVIHSAGRPLDDATRSRMESRFGQDFSKVRIHTDDKAAASARAVDAYAYTVGRHVVFGARQYAPGTGEGQRLLAHELTHVVQQKDAQPTTQLRVESASSGAEQQAHSAAANVGATTSIGGGSGGQASVQRSSYTLPDLALDVMLTPVVGVGPQKDLLVAAMGGFVDEMKTQLVDEKKGEAAFNKLKELKSPSNVGSLVGGYTSGALLGVISPLTGLFDLTVFAESMQNLASKLGGNLLKGGGALIGEATELVGQLREFGREAVGWVKGLSFDTIFKFLTELPAKAREQAGAIGHGVAHKMIRSLEETFEEKKSESWTDILTKRKEGESYDKPLGLASAMWERGKEKLLSTPWAKIGHEVGYAVGAIVVNLLLLATTGGIGNAIAEVGTALGRIAPALSRVAEAIKAVGSGVAAVEHAIGLVFSKVLKPLEPLMAKLGPVLQKLRAFLRRLLGLAEEEAGAAAAAGAKALASGEVKPKAPATPTKPAPRAQPKTGGPVKPKSTTASSSPGVGEPHGGGHRPPEPAPASPAGAAENTAAEKAAPKSEPLAKEPVSGGHTVEVTQRGIEVCSPKPCPVLHVEYAKELEADLQLRKELESIDKLRKSNPKDAARRAAKLREELEWRRQKFGKQEPLVALKIQGRNKGQYWQEGTPEFAKRALGDPAYTVVPKSEVAPITGRIPERNVQSGTRKFRPAGSQYEFEIDPRRAPDGSLRESLGAGERPRNPHPVTSRVSDQKTGLIKNEQARIDARATAVEKTIQADLNQAAGYNHLLDNGEYGLLRPGNVSTGGVDAITVKYHNGRAEIYLNDFTSPGAAKGPKPAHDKWRKELEAIIAKDKLQLANPKLEDAIREAAKPGSGRVFTRTVRIQRLQTGGVPRGGVGPVFSGVTMETPVRVN